jgi:hypothetical protein
MPDRLVTDLPGALMNRTHLALALSISLTFFAATRARACGQGYSGSSGDYTALYVLGAGLAAGVAAIDIAFTEHDASADFRPSAGLGVLEVLTSAPQVYLFGLATAAAGRSNSGGAMVLFGALTVWTSVLTIHGLWSIGAAAVAPTPTGHIEEIETNHPPPPDPPPLQLGLSPTYVDVGQRSSPGFGIVGRF